MAPVWEGAKVLVVDGDLAQGRKVALVGQLADALPALPVVATASDDPAYLAGRDRGRSGTRTTTRAGRAARAEGRGRDRGILPVRG